eukprot:6195859-Pleurochrysis_carterae.AAC.3
MRKQAGVPLHAHATRPSERVCLRICNIWVCARAGPYYLNASCAARPVCVPVPVRADASVDILARAPACTMCSSSEECACIVRVSTVRVALGAGGRPRCGEGRHYTLYILAPPSGTRPFGKPRAHPDGVCAVLLQVFDIEGRHLTGARGNGV